jgi:FkbM family methyltransferase
MSDTVMDIGMYDGSDTAYYLFRGYRVIAVDANPRMIMRAQSRFKSEIRTGQLTLLNLAISDNFGSSKLYISNEDEGSSTMCRGNLEIRGEGELEAIEVRCVPFSWIMEKYDIPYYLKIDIEGSDRYCLEAIHPASAPRYVSWEAGQDAVECLNLMRHKGYTRFKLINQSSFYDMCTVNSIKFRVLWKLKKLFRRPRPIFSPHRDWSFVRGHSSGPCCEATSGRWYSYEEIVHAWTAFCRNRRPDAAWYDIHAALRLPDNFSK